MSRTLLIVGASGRAAAASAVRAGWQPVVIDLFADDDTRAMGPVFPCPMEEYPHGFVALAEQIPPGPWMYTGGLENDPEVVEEISRDRQLFGVGPEVLKRVRDPYELSKIVRMPRIVEPPGVGGPHRGEPGGSLRKPLRGAGGLGIRFAGELDIPSPEYYFQEFIPGPSYSALFLFSARGYPEVLGISSQLIGEWWLHAPPFHYCGNVGPLPTDNGLSVELRRIGEALRPLGLRGLIGVDFMLIDREVVVLEVNPRYTASVELYERVSERSLLAEHIDCFADPGALPRAENCQPVWTKIHGKAILYADRTFKVPSAHPWRGPEFADIPMVGSVISAGQPVVTLFASADTEPECRERLLDLARVSLPR